MVIQFDQYSSKTQSNLSHDIDRTDVADAKISSIKLEAPSEYFPKTLIAGISNCINMRLTPWEPWYDIFILGNQPKTSSSWFTLHSSSVDCGRELFKLETLKRFGKFSSLE